MREDNKEEETEKKASPREKGRMKLFVGYLGVIKIVKVDPGPVTNELYGQTKCMMDRIS